MDQTSKPNIHTWQESLASLETLTFIVVGDCKLGVFPQYTSDMTEDSFKLH